MMNAVADSLFELPPVFFGETFDPAQDGPGLARQLKGVLEYLQTHDTATLAQLAEYTNSSEAGCSARIRDLRNQHGYTITGERVKAGSRLRHYRLMRGVGDAATSNVVQAGLRECTGVFFPPSKAAQSGVPTSRRDDGTSIPANSSCVDENDACGGCYP